MDWPGYGLSCTRFDMASIGHYLDWPWPELNSAGHGLLFQWHALDIPLVVHSLYLSIALPVNILRP